MKRFGTMLCFVGMSLIVGAGTSQAAYTVLYDNTTNYTGEGFGAGGATPVNGSNTTAMFADDITVASGLGGYNVNSISFSVANFNATAVSASVELYFYNCNPINFNFRPTSLITSLTFTPITFNPGVEQVYNITSSASFFTMPTGLFWAGISFSDFGGTTGATPAELDELGMGIFNPPDVGFSQNAFFQSNSASTNGSDYPSGGFYYFGGSPVASFGWGFAGSQPAGVPEPSSLAMTSLALGVLATGSRLSRKHRVVLSSGIQGSSHPPTTFNRSVVCDLNRDGLRSGRLPEFPAITHFRGR